ncbi:hypothetical protein Hokovirus_4_36 [Hokovirus HKV1]|uniref:Uncharacterized protein n=1 Tax=Hokovirus HKV1 TaxID=1977638 RepID=A0A1V0SH68_9VIRU|nr:hypothetical protein Hokovirus_4_36 [Hokovirus HKV1]
MDNDNIIKNGFNKFVKLFETKQEQIQIEQINVQEIIEKEYKKELSNMLFTLEEIEIGQNIIMNQLDQDTETIEQIIENTSKAENNINEASKNLKDAENIVPSYINPIKNITNLIRTYCTFKRIF